MVVGRITNAWFPRRRGEQFNASEGHARGLLRDRRHRGPISKEKTKRFQNELAFCERENHPAILRIVDYGHVTEGGKKLPFYVMPLYRGTLRTYIKGRIDPDISLKTFVRILDGVEAAHLLRVWHRDLKPENLLFDKNPAELVVADFGIAHFAEDLLATMVETHEDARMANFAYAAPEQRLVGGRVYARPAPGLVARVRSRDETAMRRNPTRSCCHNQFLVQGAHVAWYRAVGGCYTDCSVRPSSRPCVAPDQHAGGIRD